MARPEIPSIVVHNGSASAPGSPSMEFPSRSLRPAISLPKQTSLTGEEDLEEESGLFETGDLALPSSSISSPHPSSLPVTPCSPSPAVSPSSPTGGTPSGSPSHLRSSTPSGNGSSKAPSSSNPNLPQGPGPGGGGDDTSEAGLTMAVGPATPSGLGGVPVRSRSSELFQQRSSESDKDSPVCPTNRHRTFHSNKLRLLQRSHAMRDDNSPSPPPDMLEGTGPLMPFPYCHTSSNNNLTVNQVPPMGCSAGANRRRLRNQGSSQGSFDGSSPCLSRDSSMEYTDSTGVDLLQFIIQTLHKNQKDRMLLLKIERELISIVKDPKRTHHKFPQMSSYQRMLVHRCAAYFGLDHNVDQVGTSVIVNKTRNTRLPETRFKEHIRDELLPPDEPRRSILRRGFASFEDSSFRSPDRLHSIESRRCKSFEEREEEYEKVRRRIFSDESFSSIDAMSDSPGRRFHYQFDRHYRRSSHDDPRWPDSRHFLLGDPESHRKYYDNHRIRPSRLPKVESFESHDALNPRALRPPVFKSHSFGGYSGGVTVLSRGDSVVSNPSLRLSKQDSTGSRFSDHSSSSGYKTQRQDTSSTNISNTLSTTPSPTAAAGQYQHPSFGQHAGVWGGDGEGQPVMWAVTDMEAVPSGAMLINPQSGQPYINPDGSVYRYDPSNPPPILSKSIYQKSSTTKEKDDGMDRRLQGVSESDTTSSTIAPAPLSPGSGGVAQSAPQGHQGPESTPVTCSSPDKQFGPHPIVSASDSLQDDGKGESIETDDGSEEASFSSKEKESQRKHTPHSGDQEEEEGQSYHHYMPPLHMDIRPISHESISEVGRDFRNLTLSSSGSGSEVQTEVTSPAVTVGTPVPHGHGYMMPRHQYSQALYYMPPATVANLPGGSLKYMYPNYHMTQTQAAGCVRPTSHPDSSLQSHPASMQPLPSLGSVPTIPTIPQAMTGPGPPQPPSAVGETNAPIPPGYVPSSYTVLAYPSSGLLSAVSNTGGGHESGGTTYYCPLPGPSAVAPGATAGTAGTPAGAAASSTSLQQYAITPTSTASASYPAMALGFYSASGMNSNGIYHTPGMPGFPGGLYGAAHSHGAVTPQTPQAAAAAVSFRAPTPPQTPCTQGVGLPVSFNSAGGSGPPPPGVGGQYIAVLPPQQPPTPTSHAPQIFHTFFRPSMQMLSGSTGTPPPQPVLQYGGVTASLPIPPGAVTPHPPVFGKPFMGSSFLISGTGNEPQGSGASKEDGKRYAGSGGSMPHSGGTSVPSAPTMGATHSHLLPRPYSFMQNSMAGCGAGGFRPSTPFLITGPGPCRPLLPSSAGPLNPFNLQRPQKLKRQKTSRSIVTAYGSSSCSSSSDTPSALMQQ